MSHDHGAAVRLPDEKGRPHETPRERNLAIRVAAERKLAAFIQTDMVEPKVAAK